VLGLGDLGAGDGAARRDFTQEGDDAVAIDELSDFARRLERVRPVVFVEDPAWFSS
jgi:hypothetical protein